MLPTDTKAPPGVWIIRTSTLALVVLLLRITQFPNAWFSVQTKDQVPLNLINYCNVHCFQTHGSVDQGPSALGLHLLLQ